MAKMHPVAAERLRLARSIAQYAPKYRGVSRWAREVSLLTAAFCYTYRPNLHVMEDWQYDALVKAVCNAKDTSPYFKECVDMKALKRTGSATAIDFSKGIAQFTADRFTDGWTPGKGKEWSEHRIEVMRQDIQERLGIAECERLHPPIETGKRSLLIVSRKAPVKRTLRVPPAIAK